MYYNHNSPKVLNLANDIKFEISIADRVELWNVLCEHDKDYDKHIHEMSELDEFFKSSRFEIGEVLYAVLHDDFDRHADYFFYSEYECKVFSIDYSNADSHIGYVDIAVSILNHPEWYILPDELRPAIEVEE